MTCRLLACGLVLVATACGSPQPASSGSSATAPPTSTSVAVARCSATVLNGRIEPTDAGAGNRYGKLFVTNTGAQPCTLNGYSGLQLLAADGKTVPTHLERVADPGPAPLELAPRSRAAANLHWSVVPSESEPVDTPCQPEPSSASAIPPDETKPMSLTWSFGPVCGGGRIEISAFYAA